MKQEKYLVTEMFDDEAMAIDWKYVPESFLPKISKNLYNVSAVREDGTIVERTVIFIKPVDVFVRDVDLTEFAGILLGKEIKK